MNTEPSAPNTSLEANPLGDLGIRAPDPSHPRRQPQAATGLPAIVTPSSSRAASPPPGYASPHGRAQRDNLPGNSSNARLNQYIPTNHDRLSEPKSDPTHDWYVEGPGRRVGYDNLTAIDWVFEYTKERQRLRALLSQSSGLVGQFKQVLDASQVWIVLVLTGVSAGVLAAVISVAGDWLGDIKSGYCKQGTAGGQFYLNKSFCCWGHDDLTECGDWTPWREALNIGSAGGGYVVEYLFFVLYSVLFAMCAAILVQQYAIYAQHSGIPEIKTVLGGFVMRHFMGAWTLVIKTVGLCLVVASGLWLGKEGPLVHVACCCANIIMKPFDTLSGNEAQKREVLSAAAAAGISVAFGSPIGGVLFSLEQLSYYFPDKTMWQSFVCAMVAAVTLKGLNPFHTDKIVPYQVSYTRGWHSFEIVPFVMLGILGGIYGGLFTKINVAVARFRQSEHNPLRDRPILQVVVVAALTALINFPNLFMRAQLSELVSYLFAECAAIGTDDIFGLCKITTAGSLSIVTLLSTAAVLGFLLSSVTFGLQIPAGIILPSLAIGALYGRALGIVAQLFQKHHPTSFIFAACEPDVRCITPGTYAIVGAASALAGVTRMTVSIVVIMFELTGALTYVLPIMIAVMLSKWMGDAISSKGIYESWIQLNQYPYLENKGELDVPEVPVSNLMTRFEDMICLNASQPHTIASLKSLLAAVAFRGFPVVSSSEMGRHTPSYVAASSDAWDVDFATAAAAPTNILLGYISRGELSYALELALAAAGPTTGTHASVVGRGLALDTPCYFVHSDTSSPLATLDLRPWMDQTPITLNASSSFQLAARMFQRLGVRYLLLVERGALKGLLTKKDIWWALNASEHRQDGGRPFVEGAGVLREAGLAVDEDGEDRGLLQRDDDDDEQQQQQQQQRGQNLESR